MLLHINHTLKCGQGFLHDTLKLTELGSFVSLGFQELIVVLSDIIEYHRML